MSKFILAESGGKKKMVRVLHDNKTMWAVKGSVVPPTPPTSSILWNGDTTNRDKSSATLSDSYNNYMYKISDVVPTKAQIIGTKYYPNMKIESGIYDSDDTVQMLSYGYGYLLSCSGTPEKEMFKDLQVGVYGQLSSEGTDPLVCYSLDGSIVLHWDGDQTGKHIVNISDVGTFVKIQDLPIDCSKIGKVGVSFTMLTEGSYSITVQSSDVIEQTSGNGTVYVVNGCALSMASSPQVNLIVTTDDNLSYNGATFPTKGIYSCITEYLFPFRADLNL